MQLPGGQDAEPRGWDSGPEEITRPLSSDFVPEVGSFFLFSGCFNWLTIRVSRSRSHACSPSSRPSAFITEARISSGIT